MNNVRNIEELMAEFDISNENKLENPEHMRKQFEECLERNNGTLLDGYSQVLYLDRSRMSDDSDDKVIEVKALWFNSQGEKVERPSEIINEIKKIQSGEYND